MLRMRHRLDRLESLRPEPAEPASQWSSAELRVIANDHVAGELHQRCDSYWQEACRAYEVSQNQRVLSGPAYQEAVLRTMSDDHLRLLQQELVALHLRIASVLDQPATEQA